MITISTYEAADLPVTKIDSQNFTELVSIPDVKKRVKAVISTEAPITEWLLIKRVINSFQVYKSGSKIRPFMTQVLKDMKLKVTVDETGNVYWSAKTNPKNYNKVRVFGSYEETCRDVTQVPTVEIANALQYVLRDEAMEEDVMIRTAAQLLGCTRIGANVREGMQRGLRLALKEKKIRRGKGVCSLMK